MKFTKEQNAKIKGIAAASAAAVASSFKGKKAKDAPQKTEPDDDMGETGTCPKCGHEAPIADFED